MDVSIETELRREDAVLDDFEGGDSTCPYGDFDHDPHQQAQVEEARQSMG